MISHSALEAVKITVKSTLLRADLEVHRGAALVSLANLLEERGIAAVIDVGANYGQFGHLLRRSGYRGEIYSFEPMREAYSQLSKRSKKDKRWHVFNCGLGDVHGDLPINVSLNSHSSSLRKMLSSHLDAAPSSRYISTETVSIRCLENEVGNLHVDPAKTFLKIDTQGYEEQVLIGAGRLLGEFNGIQLELSLVPLYENQALFHELVPKLTALGYQIWRLDPGFSDRCGRMLQCDGTFFK